jgi:hypothetical protein
VSLYELKKNKFIIFIFSILLWHFSTALTEISVALENIYLLKEFSIYYHYFFSDLVIFLIFLVINIIMNT